MSYSIRYGQDTKAEAKLKRHKNKTWFVLVMAAVMLAAGIAWHQAGETVQRLLFPWWDEATAAMFGEMLQQISEGTAVSVALMDFCRGVIGNGLAPV